MRKRFGVALAALVAVFLLTVPTAFGGVPVTKTLNFPLNGSSSTNIFDLGPYVCCEFHVNVFGADIGGDISAELLLDMGTTLSAPTHSDLTFTDTNLRQGKTLDLTNTYARDSGGKLDVSYTATAHLQAYGFTVDPSKTESDTLNCSVPLMTESCSHTKAIGLYDLTILELVVGRVNVNFSLPITTTADLNGPGVSSNRTMSITDIPIFGPGSLTFTSDPFVQPETKFLSCSLPANQTINYAMDTATSPVAGSVQENLNLAVSVVGSPDIGPDFTVAGPFNLIPGGINLPSKAINPINLSAPGQNVDLGTLLPNNVAPTVAMGTIPTDGKEGSPIQLSVIGTGPGGSLSPCGDDGLDIHWSFDDGGSAYGKTVNHAWADNFLGSPPHTGQVVITDPTGLKTTKNFSVPVANVNPTVGAGPAKTAYWGTPVLFHGNGADAGSVDNGILLYSWDFGDPDSAIGGAGQDVSHTYAKPGARTAMVIVTDNDGATGTSTVAVSVIQRGSTTGYTGATTFVVTDAGTFRAALSDNLTAGPIAGRTVGFYEGATLLASGITDNGGVATASYTFPLGTVGSHTITAKFAGDSLYTASDSGGTSVNVTKNTSVLTYTGVLVSSPSKAVTLTAKLTDDLGRPLSGKQVFFTLGSQGCNGFTIANGTVTCTISKLTQNPGKYPFTVNFGGDVSYTAAGVNAVFTIGK